MRLLSLLALGIAVSCTVLLILAFPVPFPPFQRYGVTFSVPHTRGLGLNWQAVYQAILSDLGVKKLRLIAYWPEIERTPDTYDFTDLDYQMDEAQKHGAAVTVSLGRKLPRWPECHVPTWAQPLSEAEQQERVLKLLEKVVARYATHPSLERWQLENEPFLDFGICPPADANFLRREERLIRRFSPQPIVITDSGELNWWLAASRYGDEIGTTMYRTVYSGRLNTVWHYDYIFPAWLYRTKARAVRMIRGKNVLIAELQGEPWGKSPFTELTSAERAASLTPDRLRSIQQFALRTQLPLAYWWGVEYWYWEKETQNNPTFWETARTFFQPESSSF